MRTLSQACALLSEKPIQQRNHCPGPALLRQQSGKHPRMHERPRSCYVTLALPGVINGTSTAVHATRPGFKSPRCATPLYAHSKGARALLLSLAASCRLSMRADPVAGCGCHSDVPLLCRYRLVPCSGASCARQNGGLTHGSFPFRSQALHCGVRPAGGAGQAAGWRSEGAVPGLQQLAATAAAAPQTWVA